MTLQLTAPLLLLFFLFFALQPSDSARFICLVPGMRPRWPHGPYLWVDTGTQMVSHGLRTQVWIHVVPPLPPLFGHLTTSTVHTCHIIQAILINQKISQTHKTSSFLCFLFFFILNIFTLKVRWTKKKKTKIDSQVNFCFFLEQTISASRRGGNRRQTTSYGVLWFLWALVSFTRQRQTKLQTVYQVCCGKIAKEEKEDVEKGMVK